MNTNSPSSGAARRRPRRRRPTDTARNDANGATSRRHQHAPVAHTSAAPSRDTIDAGTTDGNIDGSIVSDVDPAATFSELGVPAPIVDALAAQRRRRTVPDPDGDTARLARRTRRARPRQDRQRQDHRVRDPHGRARSPRPARRRDPSRPRALILVPTRELANQVAEALDPVGRGDGAAHHRRSSAASARARRSPLCGAASTSSSPAPAGSRTSSRRATAGSTASRSPCSTRPITWPTSASCPP